MIIVVVRTPFPSTEEILQDLREALPQAESIELISRGQAIGIKISAPSSLVSAISQTIGAYFCNIPLEIIEI